MVMPGRNVNAAALFILTLLGGFLMLPTSATAGCGCDHPAPDWAPVMPYFAPEGGRVRIHADKEEFTIGEAYEVSISGMTVPGGGVVAASRRFIEVDVPRGVGIGPVSVRVWRRHRSRSGRHKVTYANYDESVFTVLPDWVVVPPVEGVFESKKFDVAVDGMGTVLLPLDLSQIHEATQFALRFKNLALAFGVDDVEFYSREGVNLGLFTLAVDDETERHWGSYYGWEVNEDGGLGGYRFDDRAARARDIRGSSDILTYWRHDFKAYAIAHQPGQDYEVNENGFHKNGTLHVEHDFIVLAIHGRERSAYFPTNRYLESPLDPGKATVRLNVAIQEAVGPIEAEAMVTTIDTTSPKPLDAAIAGGKVKKSSTHRKRHSRTHVKPRRGGSGHGSRNHPVARKGTNR